MAADRDFAFLIDTRRKAIRIYIVEDNVNAQRIPKPKEPLASYTISEGKLTIINDNYDAIAQPEIYDAVMQALERFNGSGRRGLHLISDDWLSDYMNGQIDD